MNHDQGTFSPLHFVMHYIMQKILSRKINQKISMLPATVLNASQRVDCVPESRITTRKHERLDHRKLRDHPFRGSPPFLVFVFRNSVLLRFSWCKRLRNSYRDCWFLINRPLTSFARQPLTDADLSPPGTLEYVRGKSAEAKSAVAARKFCLFYSVHQFCLKAILQSSTVLQVPAIYTALSTIQHMR